MKRERLPACVALLTDTSCAQILLALSRTATARSTELGEAAGGRGPPPCGRGAYRGVPHTLGLEQLLSSRRARLAMCSTSRNRTGRDTSSAWFAEGSEDNRRLIATCWHFRLVFASGH